MSDVPGIRHENVRRWMDSHVGGVNGDLRFHQIAGGHSNLTFTVSDGSGRRWVLRRPPLGHVLATAHDMAREHRVISALADSGVPVPGIVGLCEDTAVNDAPFYVMEFVEGVVVRTVEEAEQHAATVAAELANAHARESAIEAVIAGDYRIEVALSPTLNTLGGEPMRIGVQVDDGPVEILTFDLEATGTEQDTPEKRAWAQAVIDNLVRLETVTSDLARGKHRLKLYRIDDNVVIDHVRYEPAPIAN